MTVYEASSWKADDFSHCGLIAGATDFANNAIDLGSKLGIELQLPPAP